MEVRASEDDQTHGEVAEDASDEDSGVEDGDDHESVVVVHLLGAQDHAEEL